MTTFYTATRLQAESIGELAELPEPKADGTRSDEQYNNDTRAYRGTRLLIAHAAIEGDMGDLQGQMADLLADLRHAADALGLDFHAISDHSYNYYRNEIAGAL